jgi:ribosomal protein S18 acetylase RimI-like enzyme
LKQFAAPVPFSSGPSFSIYSRWVLFAMFEDNFLAPRLNLVVATAGEEPPISDLNDPAISLTPIRPADEPFLYQTFASTRSDEMALTGWNAEQQEAFLRMQYEAQRRSYLLQLPSAQYWMVRRDEIAVGRLILDRTTEEIHIVDIALLPEFRRLGIGSHLMRAIMNEASETAKAVRLHVERSNPALHWYERLGFGVVNSGPIYLEMVWWPRSEAPSKREQQTSGSESKVESGLCRSI